MWKKIKPRGEILVAAVGLLMFWMIRSFNSGQMPAWVTVVLLVLALVYILLILYKPVNLLKRRANH